MNLTWPCTISLHRRKARASEGTTIIAKHKFRASNSKKTLLNVSSNRSWHPPLLLALSQGPPIAPGTLSTATRSHRGVLLEPSWAFLKLYRSLLQELLLALCHPQTRNGEPAVAGYQPPACNHHPPAFQDLRKGSGGRWPKALNICIYTHTSTDICA